MLRVLIRQSGELELKVGIGGGKLTVVVVGRGGGWTSEGWGLRGKFEFGKLILHVGELLLKQLASRVLILLTLLLSREIGC